MENKVNVESIMMELKEKAAARVYPKEALDFEVQTDDSEDDEIDFYMAYLKRDINLLNQSYFIDYEVPITGKAQTVKRWIRKLYRFHLKPLSEKQNNFNMETVFALNQIYSFIGQELKEKDEMKAVLERLERQCGEQKKRIERLERMLEAGTK